MAMRATSGISKAGKCTAGIATAFCFATPGADDDTFSVASGSLNPLVGVWQTPTVNAGDSGEIMVSGISNIVCGGNITRGQEVTSDANGHAMAAPSYPPASGLHTAGIALESGVAGDIIAVLLEPDHMQPVAVKGVVALLDAAGNLAAADMVNNGIFTITPTAARAITTDSAANIVAAIPGAQAGSWFDFTLLCEAAFNATLTAGAGVTIAGNAVCNDSSASYRALLTDVTPGAEAVTIYRL